MKTSGRERAEQERRRARARRATEGGGRRRAGASSRRIPTGCSSDLAPRAGRHRGRCRSTAGRSSRRARTRPASGRAPKRNGAVTSSTRAPARAERGGQLVVVRRREGGGIGEDDVHRRRATTVPVASAAGTMGLVVRTWNVFHGNADPPRRAGYLRRMIELVTADGPDVVCLQEVPVWALRADRRLVGDAPLRRRHAARRSGRGRCRSGSRAPHQGFFRSGLAGQANAILVAPRHAATDLGHERISEHGRERRLVHAVRIAGSAGVTVANLHASNDHRAPRGAPRPRRRARRRSRSASRRCGDVVVLAGDFNVVDPGLAAYSAPGDGIDHVLVRGARVGSVVAWPGERRRAEWRRALRPPRRRGVASRR